MAPLVDRMPQTKVELSTFTTAEIERVIAAARDDRMEIAWHLALYGLGRGEVAGLRRPDVDLKACRLQITNTRVTVAGAAHESMPKTARSRRELPISDAPHVAFTRAKRRLVAGKL